MRQYIFILASLFAITSCRKYYSVEMPDTRWDQFESPGAAPLSPSTRARMEGVYTFVQGGDFFGSDAALKWSYTANGHDTTYHLSIFCQKDVTYIICEGRRVDSTILLSGYWRKMSGTGTGIARFTITTNNGSRYLLGGSAAGQGGILLTGTFGNGSEVPSVPVYLNYQRPLFNAKPLQIVVHRGGGQTADLLPASENSAEIISYASRFGASGIEIDVRLTKDGVPILYHDADLNERLIIKNGLVGPVEDYTYDQLHTMVRLIRNQERIPTLREALETVVYKTPLRFVWLDTKFDNNMQVIRDLQAEYMQKAAAIGRTLEILIGIPDKQVLTQFMKLPNYQSIPSVCELDPEYVQQVNARVWGPRWTLGLQNEAVQAMHAQGRRAFVWTLDVPQNIQKYMNEGAFDGILTDYPSAVAYFYYAQQ